MKEQTDAPPLLNVYFEITDRCNLRCFYCCKDFRGHPGLTMSRTMLDNILALPVRGLIVSGGEPSLAKEQVAYVLERASVPVAINTNLTGWTPDELYALSGRARLYISVPSMFEDEYRAITGADTFQRLLRNLDCVDRNQRIGIVVHTRNRVRLAQSVGRLAVRGFHRFLLQPAYGTAGQDDDFAASLKAVEDIHCRFRQLDIRFMAPCGSGLPSTHSCDAGLGRVVILSNGDMVPCACRALPVLGNLATADFAAVRKAGAAFYKAFPLEQQPLCKGYLKELPCC